MTQAHQLRHDCKLLICQRVRLYLGKGGKEIVKEVELALHCESVIALQQLQRRP